MEALIKEKRSSIPNPLTKLIVDVLNLLPLSQLHESTLDVGPSEHGTYGTNEKEQESARGRRKKRERREERESDEPASRNTLAVSSWPCRAA